MKCSPFEKKSKEQSFALSGSFPAVFDDPAMCDVI